MHMCVVYLSLIANAYQSLLKESRRNKCIATFIVKTILGRVYNR